MGGFVVVLEGFEFDTREVEWEVVVVEVEVELEPEVEEEVDLELFGKTPLSAS